jgi:hypothetical protein
MRPLLPSSTSWAGLGRWDGACQTECARRGHWFRRSSPRAMSSAREGRREKAGSILSELCGRSFSVFAFAAFIFGHFQELAWPGDSVSHPRRCKIICLCGCKAVTDPARSRVPGGRSIGENPEANLGSEPILRKPPSIVYLCTNVLGKELFERTQAGMAHHGMTIVGVLDPLVALAGLRLLVAA